MTNTQVADTVKHAQIFADSYDTAREAVFAVDQTAELYGEELEVTVESHSAQVKVGNKGYKAIILIHTMAQGYGNWEIHKEIQRLLGDGFFVMFAHPDIDDTALLTGIETSEAFLTMYQTNYYSRANEGELYYDAIKSAMTHVAPSKSVRAAKFNDSHWLDSISGSRPLMIVRVLSVIPVVDDMLKSMMGKDMKTGIRIYYTASAK